MTDPTTTTTTIETHELTHADITEALRRFVLARSKFGGSARLDQIDVHISPNTSWEAEGEATVKVVVST